VNLCHYAGTSLDAAGRVFLAATAWNAAACEPLTGDASVRQYYRLRKDDRSIILMDASRIRESVTPFVRIAHHLHELGFSVPSVLARDDEKGFLLLEDFGDDTFARLLEHGFRPDRPERSPCPVPSNREEEASARQRPGVRQPSAALGADTRHKNVPRIRRQESLRYLERGSEAGDAELLYTLATNVLIALHKHRRSIPKDLRIYHPEKMIEDLELFLQWRTPAISDAARSEFRAVWREVLPLAHRVPVSLLLRDYHAANLMWLPDREGIRRAGLLDFQDAYQGPVTYDLMSLLEDARHDVPEGLRRKMVARYLAQFPALNCSAFETSLAVVAAQRHTRVLAIFERLSRLEGKHDYRNLHSPRVERLLQQALNHPTLAGVKRWMERYAG
jgi:aminoglycoside/choline kinase family phosphotransferase